MPEQELVKCPVCRGHPRRWLSFEECMRDCIHPGSYEDCTNCEDGLVPTKASNQQLLTMKG